MHAVTAADLDTGLQWARDYYVREEMERQCRSLVKIAERRRFEEASVIFPSDDEKETPMQTAPTHIGDAGSTVPVPTLRSGRRRCCGGCATPIWAWYGRSRSSGRSRAELRRPAVLTCHSQVLLAAAGAMGGVRCTAFFSLRPLVELAGGTWVEPDPFSLCVADGHVLTAIAQLLRAMGARVHGGRGQGVLFLCVDYMDNYEANVPFRALDAVGCRVEAACPTKRKGEACITVIYEDVAGAAPGTVSDEKREHNFAMTVDWADIDVDDYECVVVPGGRSPELLVTKEEAVALVVKFAAKGEVVGSIDQGHLVLAAAGLLKGKRCAGRVPMRVISNLTGAVGVEPEGAVADGKLVTAASWPDLAEFIAHLVDLLGITVSF
ncbi:intracellular protease, PfpI family protein [Hordeum vulgare]|nr:intracellular protease, PfpI family protein [Hordeum vulgare]